MSDQVSRRDFVRVFAASAVGGALLLPLSACSPGGTASGAGGGGESEDADSAQTRERSPNQIAGSWRMVSAVVDPGGRNEARPYGPRPRGLLTFSPDGTFVELLQNPDIPEFEADARDEGTCEENAAAMAGALGQFGTYSVDENGVYESNTIVGSTFPNWNGLRRVRPRLTLTVRGDQLIEELRDPGAPLIRIVFQRVR